ncbi:MAG: hypothetical protein M1510_12965, partial [Nitrospirae bacterium]|nr:hypothetical protein [Nitrospirota bacterium]
MIRHIKGSLRAYSFFILSAGLLLVLPVTGAGRVHAAEKQLHLTEAVRLALENNYEVKASGYSLESGKIE